MSHMNVLGSCFVLLAEGVPATSFKLKRVVAYTLHATLAQVEERILRMVI
jgi:hypothetical protein